MVFILIYVLLKYNYVFDPQGPRRRGPAGQIQNPLLLVGVYTNIYSTSWDSAKVGGGGAGQRLSPTAHLLGLMSDSEGEIIAKLGLRT